MRSTCCLPVSLYPTICLSVYLPPNLWDHFSFPLRVLSIIARQRAAATIAYYEFTLAPLCVGIFFVISTFWIISRSLIRLSCPLSTCISSVTFFVWCPCLIRPPLWSSGQSSWLQNGDVLCFLWGTNWICICYVEKSTPPLWPSGRSSWLQNDDVWCFLWRTNWIYICYVEESRTPLLSSGQSTWLQKGDVLCFLWGTNCIYICYVEESRPPLWFSGHSSWLHNGNVLCRLSN
jgi:hypothetical protein